MKSKHPVLITLAALLAAPLLLTSCEVEFSPNAEWKNVPVVYCVLDQDDDTTWARVERCYLGQDSIYRYSPITDSVNYPEGSISVALLAYSGDVLKDSMAFHYTERDRDSGSFAYQKQPLYWSRTANRLNGDYSYVLSVRNTADGSLLAKSTPVKLVRQTNSSLITNPTTTNGFKFNDADPTTHERKYCHIKWNSLANARLYQPFVRFYYRHDGVDSTYHVDLFCSTTRGSSVLYARERFLSDLKSRLRSDTCSRKVYVPMVDIYLTCCSEELNDYLFSANQSSSIDEGGRVYSNIIGGVGIVASRRTHLFKNLTADESMVPESGLKWLILNSLDSGFIR